MQNKEMREHCIMMRSCAGGDIPSDGCDAFSKYHLLHLPRSALKRMGTFNEGLELFVGYGATAQAYLKGQEEGEEELVADIEPSHCVLEHLVCEVLHNVVDPLYREGGAV